MSDTKICNICNIEKPITEYNENRKQCKSCRVKLEKERPGYKERRCSRDKRYYEKHPDKCKNRAKKYWASGKRMKHEYGITVEDYNIMFNNQNGKCAICGIHQSELDSRLYIDHDHNTSIVRGLLCRNCNFLLSFARDNPDILLSAIVYLKRE